MALMYAIITGCQTENDMLSMLPTALQDAKMNGRLSRLQQTNALYTQC